MTESQRSEVAFGVLHSLYNTITEYDDRSGLGPTEGSILAHDLNTFGDRGMVEGLRDQGTLLLTQAGHQVATLLQLIDIDKDSLTPGANARVVLELSALVCWLFDPDQTVRERVARSLSRRHYDIDQQKKAIAVRKPNESHSNIDSQLLALEERSLQQGYESLRDDKGKLKGLGMYWPGLTQLVKETLDGEFDYRVLSGLTHGNVPLLRQLGYAAQIDDSSDGVIILEWSVSPLYAAYLCKLASVAFSRAAMYKSRLFGWKSGELASGINPALKSLQALAI